MIFSGIFLCLTVGLASAQSVQATQENTNQSSVSIGNSSTSNSEMEEIKRTLREQQKRIEELQKMIEAQAKTVEKLQNNPSPTTQNTTIAAQTDSTGLALAIRRKFMR